MSQVWPLRSMVANRNLFDCKSCRFQASLTVGTIFEGTRIPLVKWYWLLYHMAMDKVGVSISEMQRILEIGQYRTAWLMAHKIRKAMADRDARYSLAGLIEMDESFFGPKGSKRGRGSERKSTVLCAVSLYQDRKGEEKPGFAHMQVVENAAADTIEDFLDRLGCGVMTKEGKQLLEAIRSDGWKSYSRTSNCNISKLSSEIRKQREDSCLGCIVLYLTLKQLLEELTEEYLKNICNPISPRFAIGSTVASGKRNFSTALYRPVYRQRLLLIKNL